MLQQLDEALLGDPELARYQCGVAVSREDLDRYSALLASSRRGAVTVLDYGCGLGGVGHWLSDHGHFRVVGLDYSRVALRAARSSPSRAGSGKLAPVCADFGAVPLKQSSIDAVVALESLYLASSPVCALRQLYGVLRPGGLLVFTVLASEGGSRSADVASVDEWEETLDEVGFRRVGRRDTTEAWRAAMTARHGRRWEERDRIRAELGPDADAELFVSAAMLGVNGRRSVIGQTVRNEFVYSRGEAIDPGGATP